MLLTREAMGSSSWPGSLGKARKSLGIWPSLGDARFVILVLVSSKSRPLCEGSERLALSRYDENAKSHAHPRMAKVDDREVDIEKIIPHGDRLSRIKVSQVTSEANCYNDRATSAG